MFLWYKTKKYFSLLQSVIRIFANVADYAYFYPHDNYYEVHYEQFQLKMMRNIFLMMAVIATTFISTACKEDLLEPPTPPFVSHISIVTQGEVLMAAGAVSEVDFSVYPPEAEFVYDVWKQDCQLKFVYADGSGKAGMQPDFITVSKVSQLSAEEGLYRVSLGDKNKKEGYNEKFVLKISRKDEDGNITSVSSDPVTLRYEKAPLFTMMSFLKENNPTAVYEDISFNVSTGAAKVVSPLISSPQLIASFDSNGADVYVDGVEQVSGVTVNDFSKPVTYTVKSKVEYSFTVELVYSGLPVVFVNTPGGREIPSKWENWLAGAELTVCNPDWTVDYSGATEVRGRGNSTWYYPKKPYALKLESKGKILGMPKHKRWVLLANWMDRTLMRNSASFHLAECSGLEYTPRGQFVELFINGKHNGNYFLCEQIKVDENRVDIDELDDDEVDGGYILELDSYYDEEFKFRSPVRDLPYMFKDPDEVNESQFEFIKNYVSELEHALYDNDRFAAGDYMDYIDLDSFADWWIVMELTGIWEPNHPKSTYMHKDKGGKLTMGPVWDFDWETYMPKNWFSINEALYYGRLFQDPRFVAKVKERWDIYKDGYEKLPEYIRSEAVRIDGSEYINSLMWPITQTVNRDENLSFEEAVDRMVTSYEERFDWMDSAIRAM